LGRNDDDDDDGGDGDDALRVRGEAAVDLAKKEPSRWDGKRGALVDLAVDLVDEGIASLKPPPKCLLMVTEGASALATLPASGEDSSTTTTSTGVRSPPCREPCREPPERAQARSASPVTSALTSPRTSMTGARRLAATAAGAEKEGGRFRAVVEKVAIPTCDLHWRGDGDDDDGDDDDEREAAEDTDRAAAVGSSKGR
jgi:hypothetical protein